MSHESFQDMAAAGGRMTSSLPFDPTIGAAVNMTLLSADGICDVGGTVDTAAVPDIEVFIACVAAGFEAVLAWLPNRRVSL